MSAEKGHCIFFKKNAPVEPISVLPCGPITGIASMSIGGNQLKTPYLSVNNAWSGGVYVVNLADGNSGRVYATPLQPYGGDILGYFDRME